MYLWQHSLSVRIKQFIKLIENNIVFAAICISFLMHFFLFLLVYCMSFYQAVPQIVVKSSNADIPLVLLPAVIHPSPLSKGNRHFQNNTVMTKKRGSLSKEAVRSGQKAVSQKGNDTRAIKKPLPEPATSRSAVGPQKALKEKQGKGTHNSSERKEKVQKEEKPIVQSSSQKGMDVSSVKNNRKKLKDNQKALPKNISADKKNSPPDKKEMLQPLNSSSEVLPHELPTHIEVGVSESFEHLAKESMYEPLYQLHQGFQAYWHPPLDSDDLHCTYRVFLTREGTIEKLILTQSSGVLIFDTAARAALMKISYPRMLWGKECIFTF